MSVDYTHQNTHYRSCFEAIEIVSLVTQQHIYRHILNFPWGRLDKWLKPKSKVKLEKSPRD